MKKLVLLVSVLGSLAIVHAQAVTPKIKTEVKTTSTLPETVKAETEPAQKMQTASPVKKHRRTTAKHARKTVAKHHMTDVTADKAAPIKPAMKSHTVK